MEGGLTEESNGRSTDSGSDLGRVRDTGGKCRRTGDVGSVQGIQGIGRLKLGIPTERRKQKDSSGGYRTKSSGSVGPSDGALGVPEGCRSGWTNPGETCVVGPTRRLWYQRGLENCCFVVETSVARVPLGVRRKEPSVLGLHLTKGRRTRRQGQCGWDHG